MYSNPAFDTTLDQALTTTDGSAREALLIEATDIAFRDQALVPLHRQVNIEAMDQRLRHTPRNDGHLLAADIQPASDTHRGN
jgi:peptide/nickel transport system substrate-binding protein